jgi:hypothetical protein
VVRDYDHVDTTEGRGDCSDHGATTVFTHIEGASDQQSRALIRAALYDTRREEPTRAIAAAQGTSVRVLTLWSDALTRADAEYYCLRVRVTDLAGNAAPVVDTCTPCGFKTDPDGLDEWSYGGEEPRWSGDDLVGGACDFESPTVVPNEDPADPAADSRDPSEGDRETPAQTQGCSTASHQPASLWALLLFAVLIRRPRGY